MKGYLRAHVEQFKYKAISTEEWKKFFLKYFQEQVIVCMNNNQQWITILTHLLPPLLLFTQASDGVFDVVDWNMWFYGRGMPTYQPK